MASNSDRWDRDRFVYERERDRERDRVRYDDDDLAYPRERDSAPQFTRVRERSEVGDRFERRFGGRAYDDDVVLRDRRYYYDDEPRRQRSPVQVDTDRRRVVIEKERIRSPSPPRRPGGLLRRQSSLDTFDRKTQRFYEREDYGPPARRDEFRPPTNVPIPLPRARALPPPRFVEREFYDDIRVSEPDHFGDDDFRPFPERVREREREKEVITTRKRNHSRESRASRAISHRGGSVRSSSRSTSVSSRSSSSSGGTTVKSEYPKKGKTRIPARLVSERALIDMRYPFIKEGNTIVIQMALGQENIDDLLKISESYKNAEAEIAASRAPEIYEERREEFFMTPAIPPPPVAAPLPPPAPIVVPVAPAPPAAPVEIVNTTTVIRDISPARTTISSGRGPVIIDTRPREYSEDVPVGPLALVAADHHHHHQRHRSQSRGDRALRAEIRDLERELVRRDRRADRELVTAERLSTGELVLYEQTVERIEESKKGVRIEKDKKGRMSISVPKYR